MDSTVQTAGDTTTVRFERQLDHPVAEVWSALTEPDHIHQWLASPGAIELRLGGRVHLVPGALAVESTVTALDPNRLLEYGWHDRTNQDVTVRWELTPKDGATRLVFTERFPAALAEADEVSGGPAELAVWHLVLDRLEATLEGRRPNLSTDGFDALLERYTRTLGQPDGGGVSP